MHTRPGTLLSNRQWLDGILVDVLRRAMDVLPGGRRYVAELPDRGQRQRLSPAFNVLANAGNDVRFDAFANVYALFDEVGARDWYVPGDVSRPFVGYKGALNDNGAADHWVRPEATLAGIADVRVHQHATNTILSDESFECLDVDATRIYSHARAPSLFEYRRATAAIERMLSPLVATVLSDMAQQPVWQPNHGLFVLPRLENPGGNASYYVQYSRQPQRVHAVGDIVDHVHALRPLLDEPTVGRLYMYDDAIGDANTRATTRRNLIDSVNALRVGLDFYRPAAWQRMIDAQLTQYAALFDDDEGRRPGQEQGINPLAIKNVLLPMLFGEASEELARYVSNGHYFQVGTLTDAPFPVRAVAAAAASPSAAAVASPGADEWAELLRTVRRVTHKLADEALVYARASGTEAPLQTVWPNLQDWQRREFGTPLLALPLLWHYVRATFIVFHSSVHAQVRLLFEQSAREYRAAELDKARTLLEQIDTEIAETQKAATEAATKHGGTRESALTHNG